MKDHALAHLDLYLEAFEEAARGAGSEVHWAETPAAARGIILDICRRAGAKLVTKSKSMVGEEIRLNEALEAEGIAPVETDLGEYIVQLRREKPSHILAPAIHVTRRQVEENFREFHGDLDPDRSLPDTASLQAEARAQLRGKYFAAEVGITGANFLVAETGETGLVTNEGNGDLAQSLARIHIVLAGIEKIVPTREAASAQLRLLARSATGQEMSVYTTFSRGSRRAEDPDGPEESHIVLLDNGRVRMLTDGFRDVLRCIRCGACLNHCPVYQSVGGHAYGTVYPGPIGAVVSPAIHGLREHGPSAECLDLLWPLRGGLSHAHPAARPDARLAGTRLVGSDRAGEAAGGIRSVVLVREAACPVRAGRAHRGGNHSPARRSSRRAPIRSHGRRVDRASGFPGAGRRPVPGYGAEERPVNARERLLTRLRAARHEAGEADDDAARNAVAQQLASRATVGPKPALAASGRVERFIAKAEAVHCTVRRLPSMQALPGAIAAELRDRNLPAAIRLGKEPEFASLNWGSLDATVGTGRREEPATVSRAAFGVAETGTLALLSGPENPVTLTFAGDHHFVALRERDVLLHFEDVWAEMRRAGLDPRTVNFVTGPSRSADIEQTMELGAHGPVAVQIYLVGEDG